MENTHSYSGFKVRLVSYVSLFSGGEIELVDHDRYEWVKPEKLKGFDFLDGDKPIIEKILSSSIDI